MSASECPDCGAELGELADGGCVNCLLQAARNPDPDFLIQDKLRYFGDYELKEVLGRGGMGMVFRAWQVSVRREVALKMINSGELASGEAVRRFRREAEAASLLDHPNIIKVYAVGEHEGHHFIAMELGRGEDLAAAIPRLKNNPRMACQIVAQIARAVHFAHQHGVLHRDLKPGNILIDEDNVPLLTDFGLAKITADHRVSSQFKTRPGRLLGTPAYMAPEQFQESAQHLTIGSEIYSLGVILYEALAGRLPYPPGNSVDLLSNIQSNTIVPLRAAAPALPRALHNICAKALRSDQKSRYQSAGELAADLDRWLNGEPVQAKAESTPELLFHWAQRNRMAVAICGILLAAFVVSTVLLIGLQEKSARVEHLIGAARSQLQADLEKLWTDGKLTYQKITSENLSILAGLEDSGIENAVHYSMAAYENNGRLTNTVDAYAPILNYLERALRKPGQLSPRFDLLLYKFNPDAREGFARGEFDIGRFGGNPYNLLRQANQDVVLIASENMEHSGVIVVRNDSKIRAVEQLHGATMAFGEESSTTSGTFAPAFLFDHGLRATDLKSFKWHPVNGNALQAVAAGNFDAAVTGLDTFTKSGLTNLVILAKFESQPPVWIARKSLGQPFIESLQRALASCPSDSAKDLIPTDAGPFLAPSAHEDEIERAIHSKRDAFFAKGK